MYLAQQRTATALDYSPAEDQTAGTTHVAGNKPPRSILFKTTDTLWSLAQKYQLTVGQIIEWNPHLTALVPDQRLKIPKLGVVHVVKKGETGFMAIARQYEAQGGPPWHEIVAANIAENTSIRLRPPSSGGGGGTTPAPKRDPEPTPGDDPTPKKPEPKKPEPKTPSGPGGEKTQPQDDGFRIPAQSVEVGDKTDPTAKAREDKANGKDPYNGGKGRIDPSAGVDWGIKWDGETLSGHVGGTMGLAYSCPVAMGAFFRLAGSVKAIAKGSGSFVGEKPQVGMEIGGAVTAELFAGAPGILEAYGNTAATIGVERSFLYDQWRNLEEVRAPINLGAGFGIRAALGYVDVKLGETPKWNIADAVVELPQREGESVTIRIERGADADKVAAWVKAKLAAKSAEIMIRILAEAPSTQEALKAAEQLKKFLPNNLPIAPVDEDALKRWLPSFDGGGNVLRNLFEGLWPSGGWQL